MRRLAPILIVLLAVAALLLAAAPRPHAPPARPQLSDAARPMVIGGAAAQDFRPLPFHQLAERVHGRYRGRLIGAGVARPTPHERDLGAALVYEFRLLTPQRNLLRIRMDARSGRFLEVAGRGQVQALRPAAERDANDDHDDDWKDD